MSLGECWSVCHCSYIKPHTHTHTRTRTHAHTHARMQTHVHTLTHQQIIITIVLVQIAEKEKRSNIELEVVAASPFFSFTSGSAFVPLQTVSVCSTSRASSTCPFNSSHLGDSGTRLCG